jgi:coatomer protein complex subunit epsilon
MDPDELYTVRAQFWLGHYQLALDECKSLMRRPMSAHLKEEREEFTLRALMAMGNYDKVINDSSGDTKGAGIRALGLRAQYEVAKATGDTGTADSLIMVFKELLQDSNNVSTSLQLTACHVFLSHGDMTREALQCVFLGLTMEHLATCVQIYLKMDRLDLAQEQLQLLKQGDEDAVLTQLCAAYIALSSGSSKAPDAVHILSTLSEQYGPSPVLLNCVALANMSAGKYDIAVASIKEVLEEHPTDADALVNLCVCYQQLGSKEAEQDDLINKLKANHPSHFYVQGLLRMEAAIEREAVKYV